MASPTAVAFKRIPRHTALFLDYLDASPKVSSFYQQFPTREKLDAFAGSELGSLSPRAEVTAILRRQNESFGTGPKGMESIDELAQPDSVAVVTGNQITLFGGPLYTIYKALTATRLANELRERGFRAVPIFWMASEDHDLAEVTRLWTAGNAQPVDYRDVLFGETSAEASVPVGQVRFPDSIEQVTAGYLASFAGGRWLDDIAQLLTSAYQPGETFSAAFGRLMALLFKEHGLVFFDSLDGEAKRSASHIFQKAIQDSESIHNRLSNRNESLRRSGYHEQVAVMEGSTVLFMQQGQERKAVTRSSQGRFSLKNSTEEFGAEELLGLATSSPERFSPNVLLRPLVQDFLFPTVAYVAGPSEIAYFAQAEVLYTHYGRPMPVIWPRASLTLLETDVFDEMRRFGLQMEDCFQGKHHIVERVVTQQDRSDTSSILTDLQQSLETQMESLRGDLVATDSSLGPALDNVKKKILHHVQLLQTKFVHLHARGDQIVLDKAELVLNNCYPNKNLQERELNILYFLVRHGPELLRRIYAQLQPGSFEHKLLKLD